MLEDAADTVPIAFALPVVCVRVVRRVRVLDFLKGLGSGLVKGRTLNSIWPIHSIQASRVDFIC